MKNHVRQSPDNDEDGYFLTVRDGLKIFVSEHIPAGGSKNTGFYRLVSEIKFQKFLIPGYLIP